MGQALDVIGWRIEHLFYYANTAGFLLMSLECRKRDSSLGPSIPRDSSLPRETRQSNTFYQQETRNAKEDSEGQSLIGHRARSINWKAGSLNWT